MAGGVEVVAAITENAIRAAIAKVVADTGEGVVLLNPGTYSVSSAIQVPTKITLQGAGKQTTKLQAAGDNTVVDVIGTNTVTQPGGIANHISSPVLSDICLDGGSNAAWSTKPMMRVYYMHTGEFRNVVFRNKFGIATLIGAECWDTDWWGCRWDNCGGTNQGLPAFLLQSADTGVVPPAFGGSGDATNDQRFFHCTWESFRDGALWTTSYRTSGSIYMFGCKADQNATALGPWFIFDTCGGVHIRDMDFATTSSGAAYLGTPYDIFTFKNTYDIELSGFQHYQNSLASDTLIHFNGTTGSGNNYVKLDNITTRQIGTVNQYGTSAVKFSGTNNWFDIGNVKYVLPQAGVTKPLFSGTLPTQMPVSLGTKAGAFAATDFDPASGPGQPTGLASLVGIDTTNGRAYFRYPDGTYHYATLT